MYTINRQGGSEWAKERGLIPETGNWDKPGHWIKPGGVENPIESTPPKTISPKKPQNLTASGSPIPPGLARVWKSKNPNAAIQATGYDSKGRKKYVKKAGIEDATRLEKYERIRRFNKDAGKLRKVVKENLSAREEARILYLIDKTWFRVGGEVETGAEEKAYGATTLQVGMVEVKGSSVRFRFGAKKGSQVDQTVDDRELAKIVTQHMRGKQPEDQLFDVSAGKVIRYLREITGPTRKFKTHDYRTHHGTKMAEKLVNTMPGPTTTKEYTASRNQVASQVAARLWNAPEQALSTYILPEVFDAWRSSLAQRGITVKKSTALTPQEAKDIQDFRVFEDIIYMDARIVKAIAAGDLGMALWGGLHINKAEEDAELGTADDGQLTTLPGVPPQDLSGKDEPSRGRAREALSQVSRLLHEVIENPELQHQISEDERERLRLISHWIKEGGQPIEQREAVNDLGYNTSSDAAPRRDEKDSQTEESRGRTFQRAVIEIAKALDIPLSVKAVIKGPQGLLLLKDAYSDYWDLPGGHAQEDETLEGALRREVKEETGLDVIAVKERGVRMMKLNFVRPVVFYDVKVDKGTLTLSEEHTGYQWAQEKDAHMINLGVFKEYLFPGAQEVAINRPGMEPEQKGMGQGDNLTNPHYEAMIRSLSAIVKVEPLTVDSAPSLASLGSNETLLDGKLDNPTPTVTKEGEGISGPGDTMTSEEVHTPVGGSHRRRENRMRIITKKASSLSLVKTMASRNFMLARGDAAQKLSELGPNSIHVCVTSPPYWDPEGPRGGLSKEDTPGEFADHLVETFRPLQTAMTSHGSLWLILGDGRAKQEDQVPEQVLKALVADGWLHQKTYQWYKGDTHDRVFHLTKQNSHYREPMFALPTVLTTTMSKLLPGSGFYAFPVELAVKVIKATCPVDGVVIDPFVGTGTSIIAALECGRRGIGIDISERELKVAERQIAATDLARTSMKLKKAVANPEQYDLKVLSKGFSGKVRERRFIVAGYASPVIIDLEGHKITHEALARDLPRFMADGGQYAHVNIMHSNITVGKILPSFTDKDGTTYHTNVDKRGLFVVAEVRTDVAAPDICRQVIDDILNNKLRSFSISGNADNPVFTCDGERCFYSIDDLQLTEITLCEEGVNPEAKFNVISKSLKGKRNRLTYGGIPLIKRVSKGGQNEADIGQGEAIQVEDEGNLGDNPTKLPFSISDERQPEDLQTANNPSSHVAKRALPFEAVTNEADLMTYFAAFTTLFKAHHPLGGLVITLYDPQTGEVLLPEE